MGVTVVDTGVVIGWLSPLDAHHDTATSALRQAVDRRADIVLPASALAEVLVGVWPLGHDAVSSCQQALARVPMIVEPLTDELAELTARVRALAKPGLKLPDAMVVATAIDLDAEWLVTTDRRWGDLATLGYTGTLEIL